jgi:hypothetical protein
MARTLCSLLLFIVVGCVTMCCGCSRSEYPQPTSANAQGELDAPGATTSKSKPQGSYSLSLTLTDLPDSGHLGSRTIKKDTLAPSDRRDK